MLNLDFELRLDERANDQVVVSVALAPRNEPVMIDGVALQWSTADGEPVSARMLLPIAGTVAQPMVSTVVLTAFRAIEPGCRVVATAWFGTSQRESSIPTDPFTELEVHVRGQKLIDTNEGDREPQRLSEAERVRFARTFPWVNDPRLPRVAGKLAVVDSTPTTSEVVDEVAEDFELDEESAAWLKELLSEDEDAASGTE